MELAVAPLGTLLQKLGTLLTDEYKLQKGVRGEIKFLQAEMESMHAVLTMLSKRPANEITDLDNIWVRDLKELSYDIEDSVDTFMVRINSQASAKPHSFTRFFERTIGLLTKAKTRHHVANDIEDIKKRINDVAARRERYNKLERVVAQPDTTIDQRRAMACFEHAAKLVGTEVPVERISNMLTNGNGLHERKRMVVSIVGVGGLGKTTTANLVYQRLGGQFDCQSFVSVSLRPNMTQILSKILRQVSNTNTSGEADLDELVRKIRKVLEDKSMFPEDYEIGRRDLIRMWVGEGFVDGEQRDNLYDLGERYFRELVNRSMIQPVGVGFLSGAPSACRVHDMILDLIITLSAQENFVTISRGPHDISSAGKIRRLSLQGSDESDSDEGDESDSDEEDSMEEKVILPATAMSHGLGSLHHLRYLELGGRVETKHLEEIGNLKQLKTLDLWGTDIKELPASIVQLRQLECLIMDDVVKFPDGMGNLVSLQLLSVLDVSESSHTLVELGLLTGLQVLVITGINESCVKTFLRSLNNLHNIRALQIEGECSLDCIPDQWSSHARLQYFHGYGILKVPRWFSSLSELSCVDIVVHILRQDDLQLLGALPVLRTLEIFVDDSGTIDERLVIGTDQPFRSLISFKFKHRARCLLVFAEGVMPKLETLELYVPARPRGGGAFDAGLENLTSLKKVEVIVDCEDATATEVQDAETKVRDTIDKLPNHPTLDISRKRFQGESYSEASKQQRSDLQDIEDECHKGSEASEQSLTMD